MNKLKKTDEEPREIDFKELNKYSSEKTYYGNLRPYQKQRKKEIYEAWETGNKNIMLQMPTGTGKTHLFASIIKDLQDYFFDALCKLQNASAESKQKWAIPKILVIVHRIELVQQIFDTLVERYGHSCGMVTGHSSFGENKNVIIASVQTIGRRQRLAKWVKDTRFDFIIIDEAHHSPADSYIRICNTWPAARLLGVTATPYRLNHQPFTDIYDHLIVSDPVYKFIQQGFLCQYEYYSIKTSSDIQKRIDHLEIDPYGDYNESAMSSLLDKDSIRASILGTYEKYARGKKGIVYTINQAHNISLATLYTKHGYRVAYIDSATPSEERKKIVDAFKNGNIEIIFNVNIFSEGFDCPDVEFIQLARPTKSLAMYLQQVGRGFRTAKGKDRVLFLDNVGLYNRFGLPSIMRKWQYHFNGREDFDEETSTHGDSLGLIGDVVDIEEGNEEVDMIYSSLESPEDNLPEETIPKEPITDINNSEEDMAAEQIVILCQQEKYVLEEMSQAQIAQLLLTIEQIRHTGVIDTARIEQDIAETQKTERRQNLLRMLKETGYSAEDFLSVMGNEQAMKSCIVQESPEVSKEETPQRRSRGGLYVKTADGKLIQEKTAKATFIAAIKIAGLKKVFDLKMPRLGDYLVSHKVNEQYANEQTYIDGYYILHHSSSTEKKRQLEQISQSLGLGWKVGIKDEEEPSAGNNEPKNNSMNVPTETAKKNTIQSQKKQDNRNNKGIYAITKKSVIIQEDNSEKTFIEILEKIGLKRVYDLQLMVKNRMMISKYPVYWQKVDDYYILDLNIITDEEKLKILTDINGKLGLGWQFGIYE